MNDPRVERSLAELAEPTESLQPDWGDVMSRANRARRRTGKLAVLGAACTIAGVSTAFAVVPHFLKPGPLAFMRTVTLPETAAPAAVRRAFADHRLAGTPRKALTLPSPRGRVVLWVSPHRGGGWCEGLKLPGTAFRRSSVQCVWWKGSYGPFSGGFVGPQLFVGRAAVTRGRDLRLRFTDGGSLGIPAKDGFYLFRVPDRRLVRSAPRALVLRDRGTEVARFQLPNFYGGERPLVGSTRRPGGADVSRARRLLVVRTSVGPAALVVAPSKLAPATCWWLQIRRATYGGGCVRNDKNTTSMWSVAPVRALTHGHELWVLWGRAGPRFASLELRFQDGEPRALARAGGGFFLYVVPGAERVRGHRPAVLTGRAPGGGRLRKELLLTFAWAP